MSGVFSADVYVQIMRQIDEVQSEEVHPQEQNDHPQEFKEQKAQDKSTLTCKNKLCHCHSVSPDDPDLPVRVVEAEVTGFYATFHVGRRPLDLLVDSGSAPTLVDYDTWNKISW